MAHLLGAENIGIAFGTRTVLEGLSLGVDEGDRIGLVGRNGDGKSTLMRILAGLQEPDTGRVTRRGGVRVGVLDQQDRLDPEHTVRQAVVGDVDDHVWASDPKVRDVLGGLLDGFDLEQSVRGLSGGQRRRVALARLLAGDDDVLFLDEPNYSMGCSLRTPQLYRRGRAASRPDARRRARGRRPGVRYRAALAGRGGR